MSLSPPYHITLIGCGKMGSSMIHGWLKQELIKRAEILDPNQIDDSLTSHPDLFHVKLMESLSLEKSNIIILAVKPQIMNVVCAKLEPILPPDIPLLSIAAGKATSYFQDRFSSHTPIIRCMPNTPAAIGKGITALYATNAVQDTHKQMAEILLGAIGQTLWIDDETQMDAITALSGSGPAYLFYLIEAMTKAGIDIGLPEDVSKQLARQTIIGSAALAEENPDIDASTLRQNVTSKGGTTEAALKILMKGEFQNILTKALHAAQARGKELAD